MYISILKRTRLGSTNLQTQIDQREIKECLHIQNTKQITIINLFNELEMLQLMILWVYKFVDPRLILYIMEVYITKWKVFIKEQWVF